MNPHWSERQEHRANSSHCRTHYQADGGKWESFGGIGQTRGGPLCTTNDKALAGVPWRITSVHIDV
jgi:hypothetical protein